MNTDNNTFQGLGIAPKLMEILNKLNFTTPTPIQRQSIPIAISGKDVIGIAQTGTGKTLAFGIPMLQQLVITKKKGLILLPTRELAVQVNEALTRIGRPLGLKTAVVIGGESMGRQLSALRLNPHIIIATPGRLIDLIDSRHLNLKDTGVLVLDEADRMLDMGFAPQLNRILAFLPKERQTMLFSATMDEGISKIAAHYLQLPTRIEVAPSGSTLTQISQEIIMVSREDKLALLNKTLEEYKGSTLVFCRTKHGATKLANNVRKMGHSASEIHSNRSLNQRLEALNGFKIGKYRVLVATDIAARGIDVTNIELVINYDLPEQTSDYVHRIGRTGRAGKVGHAISFATADQRSDIRDIERLIKKTILVKKAEGMKKLDLGPEPAYEPSYSSRGFRPERRQSRGGFGGDKRSSSRPSSGGKPFRSGTSHSGPSRDNSRSFGDKKKFGGSKFGPSRPGPSKFGGPKRAFGKPTKRTPYSDNFKPVTIGSPADRGFDL
jgi:ATP-dependent RNA helicase RhlE